MQMPCKSAGSLTSRQVLTSQTKPSREVGGLSLFFQIQSPVLSLALLQKTCWSLPCPNALIPWGSHRPFLSDNPPSPQLQQVHPDNPQARTARKAGWLTAAIHLSCSSMSVSLIPCSVDHLLGSPFLLWPHLQRITEFLQSSFPQFIPLSQSPKPAGIPCEHTS